MDYDATSLCRTILPLSDEATNAFFDEQNIPAELRTTALDLKLKTLKKRGYSALLSTSADGPVFSDLRVLADGEKVDVFTVIEHIDDGSNVQVYRARQEKPVRRDVALKVLIHGVFSAGTISRFNAEATTLARMQHPSIARIFSAGTTEGGFPFLAIEHVNGPSLTKYADGQKFSIRQRIELFLQVCDAVQHAHGKGVIHRDLKPHNILAFTDDSGQPRARVIDFGIAKATDEGEALRSMATEENRVLGTSLYASPEQLEGRINDVDTRSDVFGLGAVLVELLAGVMHVPINTETAGYELYQAVCEREPLSFAQLLKNAPDHRLREISDARDISRNILVTTLAGDLTAIARQALARQPEARYRTVGSLQADLQSYLDGHPVTARKYSSVQVMRKFIARHRLSVGLGAAALFAVLTATAIAIWMAVTASAAEATATEALETSRKRTVAAQSDLEVARSSMFTAILRHATLKADNKDYATLDLDVAKLDELDDLTTTSLTSWPLNWLRSHQQLYTQMANLSELSPRAMAMAPDREAFAFGTTTPHGIAIYRLDQASPPKVKQLPHGPSSLVWAGGPTPMIFAAQGKTVLAIDPSSMEIKKQYQLENYKWMRLALSPSNKTLVCYAPDKSVTLLRTDFSEAKTFHCEVSRPGMLVRWANESPQIFIRDNAGKGATILTIDESSLSVTSEVKIGTSRANHSLAAWLNDDQSIFYMDSETYEVKDPKTGKRLASSGGHNRPSMQVAASSKSGERLLLVTGRAIEIFDTSAQPKQLMRVPSPDADIVWGDWLPGRDIVVFMDKTGLLYFLDPRGLPKKEITAKKFAEQNSLEYQPWQWLGSLSWTPDGHQIIAGGWLRALLIFQANNLSDASWSSFQKKKVARGATAHASTMYASAGYDGTVRIYDAPGNELAKLEHDGPLDRVFWSPRDTFLVTRYLSHIKTQGKDITQMPARPCESTLWDVSDLMLPKKIGSFYQPIEGPSTSPWHPFKELNDLCWHPSERLFLHTTSSGHVRIRSANGDLLKQIAVVDKGDPQPFRCAFSPEGDKFAFVDKGGSVSLYSFDIQTLQLTKIARKKITRSASIDLSWHPSEPLLALGSNNGEISLISIPSLELSMAFTLDAGAKIGAVSWSPDGHKLAIADFGGNLAVYDASRGYQLAGLTKKEPAP